jgi:hypothetical protein
MKKEVFVCKRKPGWSFKIAVDSTGEPIADRKGMVLLNKMYMGSRKVNEYIIERDFMRASV